MNLKIIFSSIVVIIFFLSFSFLNFSPKADAQADACLKCAGSAYSCYNAQKILVCSQTDLTSQGYTCISCSSAPTPVPTQVCAQVITYARNSTTKACSTFSSSCLPAGWVADPTCASSPTTVPTPAGFCGDKICSATEKASNTCAIDCGSIQPTTPPPTSVVVVPTKTSPTPSCTLHTQGDANCDNVIDLLDFNSWKTTFIGGTLAQAVDFNNDGKVDLLDFNIWKTTFTGGSTPIKTTPVPTTVQATPVPTTASLCPAGCPAGSQCISGKCTPVVQ